MKKDNLVVSTFNFMKLILDTSTILEIVLKILLLEFRVQEMREMISRYTPCPIIVNFNEGFIFLIAF